ncbi:MAG TPA: hydantoinase/oxoprolinase family protein [Bacillota bacterium]|nr:hydantoinase/oxoprolinase family protein [Bacillota bacterium]
MRYIIGIDVGGTNTNACLLGIDQGGQGHVLKMAKAPTRHEDLFTSTRQALAEISDEISSADCRDLEIHLSTTLITNAIVEGKGDPVATIITTGPGLAPEAMGFAFPVSLVGGVIDHRGRETAPLVMDEVRSALKAAVDQGARAVAVVGKFSPRNPGHELAIEDLIQQEFPGLYPPTLGHRLSGRLNFPRRVNTCYLNAKVARLQREFIDRIRDTLLWELAALSARTGQEAQKTRLRVFLLKADGGTIEMEKAVNRPVETILSGPAASVMGALALTEPSESCVVVLDIGGTTTDIAVLVGGKPLAEKDGAVVGGFKTLVPAFFSRSIGLGGDSTVSYQEGRIKIGPTRAGTAAALGGDALTPTDAIVLTEQGSFGDYQRALTVLENFSRNTGGSPRELAEEIHQAFCEQAVAAINGIFADLNSCPVYTVSEVLVPRGLKPEKIIGLGGPAAFYIPRIAHLLGVPYEVLPYYEGANAVGAAASRPTAAITLRADTALGKVTIPELDQVTDLARPALFDRRKAEQLALESARGYAEKIGAYYPEAQFEVDEEEVFNMVRGFYTVGKLFTMKAQVKPDVIKVVPK